MTTEPIDAVVTWVNGNDPAHRRKLDAYLASLNRARPAAADPTRFDDAGELPFCLASILRFAPWFRRIHIVTDDQRPPLLDALRGTPWEDRVRLVDHREIFAGYEQHLPSFNSYAIIAALWRIDGLGDRFVYFNDDFSLIREVRPEDFFDGDTMLVRGRWQTQAAYRPVKRLAHALRRLIGRASAGQAGARVGHQAAQEESARMAGYERTFVRLFHTPYPMRRSTLEAYFAAHPEQLERNLEHRLRSPRNFNTECLAAHLDLAQGRAKLDNRLKLAHLKPDEQLPLRMWAKLRRADRDPSYAFACVQSLDKADRDTAARLTAWLEARIGSLAEALARA